LSDESGEENNKCVDYDKFIVSEIHPHQTQDGSHEVDGGKWAGKL
jgi:hypothetical protein